MAETVHQFSAQVAGHTVRAMAEPRGNIWAGWLEFQPAGGGEVLRTGQETSQPNRAAVEYWASGLEPVYLEGALTRARRVRS